MNVLKSLWRSIKRLLGFPEPANEEQQTEILITQREDRDCAVAAVATACGVTYEKAYKALWHWNLPFFLESPIFANPLNVTRAIKALGFQVNEKLKISELLKGELPPGKVICLMHNPAGAIAGTLQQHIVVWFGKDEGDMHLFHWGQKQSLRSYSEQETVNMLTVGWPNALWLVGEKR
jgi:hypothetical protein